MIILRFKDDKKYTLIHETLIQNIAWLKSEKNKIITYSNLIKIFIYNNEYREWLLIKNIAGSEFPLSCHFALVHDVK